MRRIILLLVVVAIALGAFMAYKGILSVRNTPDKVDVTVDKNKLQQETQQAAEKAKAAGDKVIEKIEHATGSRDEQPNRTDQDGTRSGHDAGQQPAPPPERTAASE